METFFPRTPPSDDFFTLLVSPRTPLYSPWRFSSSSNSLLRRLSPAADAPPPTDWLQCSPTPPPPFFIGMMVHFEVSILRYRALLFRMDRPNLVTWPRKAQGARKPTPPSVPSLAAMFELPGLDALLFFFFLFHPSSLISESCSPLPRSCMIASPS